MPDVLPHNLTVLDVSNNLLTGTLPQALPASLVVCNASNNVLSGTLPSNWSRLAELRLDSAKLTGGLPVQWSNWGTNTSNSVQLSLVDAQLHGNMPQQWVQQFCLAVVQNSREQVLFAPASFSVEATFGEVAAPATVTVLIGSPVTLMSQHASINVTVQGKLYSFSYEDTGSICSIPNATRNAAIYWGVFAGLLLATVVGLHFWLQHRKSRAHDVHASRLTVLFFRTQQNQKVRIPKRVLIALWALFTDVLYFIYSQVTDAIFIHQVFASGRWGYAVVSLMILLLPYVLVFLLVMRVCIGSRQPIQVSQSKSCWIQKMSPSGCSLCCGHCLDPIPLLSTGVWDDNGSLWNSSCKMGLACVL